MADSPLERGHEDNYFRQRDRELIEKLKRDVRQREERRKLAEATGTVDDHDVLVDLQELGYDEFTVKLLHLVPLVYVAWAEGGVSAEERALIVEAARSHGVEEGSRADAVLASWMEERPDDAFFGRTLAVMRILLGSSEESAVTGDQATLLQMCEKVAAASGGILGLGKVSSAEKKVMERVAQALQGHHEGAARKVVDSL